MNILKCISLFSVVAIFSLFPSGGGGEGVSGDAKMCTDEQLAAVRSFAFTPKSCVSKTIYELARKGEVVLPEFLINKKTGQIKHRQCRKTSRDLGRRNRAAMALACNKYVTNDKYGTASTLVKNMITYPKQ